MLLIQGTTGTNVKYLQYGLKIKCFNPKRTDGVFDANTTSALKRYQTFKRLTADGKADELTWATLKEDIKLIPVSYTHLPKKKTNYFTINPRMV